MADAPKPPKLKDVLFKDIGNIQRPQPRPGNINELFNTLMKDMSKKPEPKPAVYTRTGNTYSISTR